MDDYVAMQPVIPLPAPQSAKRRRVDLRPWRILLGLVVAPMLGAAIMAWAVSALDGMLADEERQMDWGNVAMLFFSPSLWSLAAGLLYLQTITRARNTIARYECLLLGCASGFLAPMVLAVGGDLLVRARVPDLSGSAIGFLSMGGLIALPFGLFGGWVFWRLGVRPATVPPADYAAVFD